MEAADPQDPGAAGEDPPAPADEAALSLSFQGGSLLLRGLDPAWAEELPGLRFDARVAAWRAPAYLYHLVVRLLIARGVPFEDAARAYQRVEWGREDPAGRSPRDYQAEAIEAWREGQRRGLVVLPTGSGKTLVAELAIAAVGRSALVVVPTLDLLNQWFGGLAERFGEERVGTVGGGTFEPRELTVITYDSAYLHLDRLGARFGLLICDEAHHLTGSYLEAARMCLAPFRLGLTATPPEEPAALDAIGEVMGPIRYRREIPELAGDYLSSYEATTLQVQLSDAEREAYEAARATYRGFVERHGIRLGGKFGWARFLAATNASPEGRAAFQAWRAQRQIALATPRKLALLEELLARHAGERILIFTHANQLAYEVSRRFLVPAITHQTKPRERRAILAGLDEGTLPVVVTSKVLNEGVNVPKCSVGIVLSGSATVREHVQRLGRILRKVEGKHAHLYELVTENSSEEASSKKRRRHSAYK